MTNDFGTYALVGVFATLILFGIINRVHAILRWKRNLDNAAHNVNHLERMVELETANRRALEASLSAEDRSLRASTEEQVYKALGGIHERQFNTCDKLERELRETREKLEDYIRAVKADREDLNLLAAHHNVGFRNKFSTRELIPHH